MELLLKCILVQIFYFLGTEATFIRSARQSSTWDHFGPGYSVDGDPLTFSRTGFAFDTWWTGVLDSECRLKSVEVYGEHTEMLILAGLYPTEAGFGRPTLENPRCKLVRTETVLGQPDHVTYNCDVIRNVTHIDIVPAVKKDHSLLLHEVTAHCE